MPTQRTKLPSKISAYLNQGDSVIAELATGKPDTRCFVEILPVPNPAIPREEARYLNSRHSMWEYWHYIFRRIVLRAGWEFENMDYDHYLLENEIIKTQTEAEFVATLAKWVPDPTTLRHHFESDCPI